MNSEKKRQINLPLISLCSFVVITIVMILLGIMLCKLPVVMVCTIVMIETVLTICLRNLPVWLHCLVVGAEILAGAIWKQVLFMVCASVVYIMALVVFHFLGLDKS